MARPRSFAENQVVDAAMQHFWQHGYAATTVRDLAIATGLGAASLYNAFGTKRVLFLRVVERYLDEGLRPRIARLAALDNAHTAIATFLDDIAVRSLADPARRGCLLVNTALEVAPHDAEIGAIVSARLGELEAFLAERVHTGQMQGTVNRSRDPADLARLLVTTIMGLRVLARVQPDRALLHGAVRQALALLDPLPEPVP